MEAPETTGFIEVIFPSVPGFGIDERDEIEDTLQEMLENRELGDVSGSGAGMGVMILDIDVFDARNLEETVQVIMEVLKNHSCPSGTRVQINQPYQKTHQL
ncbi:hypothetical protein [Deinococcus roseus]|nr:hypothetical protein [Deinococcus roseus]